MDLKMVTLGLSQPSRMGTPLNRTDSLAQDTVPTGDTLAISVAEMLKGLFDKTSALLAEQDTLLQSLPSQIKTTTEQILQNSLPDISTLSAGLISLLQSRRNATDSLIQLADNLHLVASLLQASQDTPSAVSSESKRFAQQVTSILEQLDLESNEFDPAILRQVRDQIQAAMPDNLRQAVNLGQRPAFAGGSTPSIILQAADKLNLPDLPKLWLLADTDVAALQGNRQKTETTASMLQSILNVHSAKLLIEIKQFAQQVTKIIEQLNLESNENTQAVLQQARDEIQASMPDFLRQTAARFVEKQSSFISTSTPIAIRQAAEKLQLPELLQLWPLTDIELTSQLADMTPTTLEHSAATVRSLAESVSRAFQTSHDDQGQAVLFTLQMPFNGDPAQLQPAHIHIFHEKGQTKNDGSETPPDTWVKVTVEPEYTGQVDAIFHLHGESILDIKLAFADKQASLLFSETVPLIREACSEFPFMLGDITVV